MSTTFAQVQAGYANLWHAAQIRPICAAQLVKICNGKILPHKPAYLDVEAATGVPWYWVAITDVREGGGGAKTYLGNGQSLSRVTTQVPAGRGPFGSFKAGAIDALGLDGITAAFKQYGVSIPLALFLHEKFNGLGYYTLGVNDPYVWSFTTNYGDPPNTGKFVADHDFRRDEIDEQPGCAALLKQLITLDATIAGGTTTSPPLPPAPPVDPTVSHSTFQHALDNILTGGVGGDVWAGLEVLAGTRKR